MSYTEDFAKKYLTESQKRVVNVSRVKFDYSKERCMSGKFILPWYQNDFVILTPSEILTRDEAWINQGDMLTQFSKLRTSLPDESLRIQVNEHFLSQINERSTNEEKRSAALRTIEKYTDVVDYYIKKKEETADDAHATSKQKVKETQEQFVENVRSLVNDHLIHTQFYEKGDSYEESLQRVAYLKQVIENQDGYRLFYLSGKPIQREADLHIMFKLTWFRTAFDVNAEVNNGRGPVDFKVSKGRRNANLVEFKLASNTGLKRNLQKQVEIYAKANQTTQAIKVILWFTESEQEKVITILKELKIQNRQDIVLIDASKESKSSGSKA